MPEDNDEDVVAGFFAHLARPEPRVLRSLSPFVVWVLAGAGVFFGVAGLLLLGWNLLVPLFAGPFATYPEAIGATIFLALGVLLTYLLKESKE